MSGPVLRLDRVGATLVATIDRPAAANALNAAVRAGLDAALDRFEADAACRCLILTAAGEKMFAAGADIQEFVGMDAAGSLALSRAIARALRRMETVPKPVIAAINGHCIGGGLELALACDVRIASRPAKLGLPEVSLGIIPGGGGTARLSRLVGPGRALEMCMGGELIDAETALRIGLVTALHDPAEVLPAALRLAETIASRSAFAVGQVKRAIREGLPAGLDAAVELEAQACAACFASPDAAEGMKAFVEKRPARFAASP
jgi:enoyl-CoA hydratase